MKSTSLHALNQRIDRISIHHA
ncbi:MAG: hypothetical protein K0Q90_1054, partial [Paenibacillaceae bacterium]|nr:hypothetical protein [Paenibacillaceae bacterium]